MKATTTRHWHVRHVKSGMTPVKQHPMQYKPKTVVSRSARKELEYTDADFKKKYTIEDVKLFASMMMEAVRETKRTGREHGFNVFKKGGTLEATEMCVGEKGCVELPQGRWGYTFLEFHTHPESKMCMPSPSDVYGSIASDTNYICMGTPQKGGLIRCFKVNREHPNVRKYIEAYKAGDVVKQMRYMDDVVNVWKPDKEWKNFL